MATQPDREDLLVRVALRVIDRESASLLTELLYLLEAPRPQLLRLALPRTDPLPHLAQGLDLVLGEPSASWLRRWFSNHRYKTRASTLSFCAGNPPVRSTEAAMAA
nr:hypothetical protein [Arthrobacter sp. B0490]